MSSTNRFDAILSVVLVIIGVSVGSAVWLTGYVVMLLLPMAAVLLSLIGAALARRHRYLVAFCTVTALNASWLVVAASRGLLTDQGQMIGLIQLIGLAWVLPLGIALFILKATAD